MVLKSNKLYCDVNVTSKVWVIIIIIIIINIARAFLTEKKKNILGK